MADAEDLDDVEDTPVLKARGDNLASRKKVREKLEKLFTTVQKGFEDQRDRSRDLQMYWDCYNCKLGDQQFYSGNAEIYVPIVYEAVTARVTRFSNQIFPQSGRYVECISSDATLPQATMSLAEHYVRKANLRTLLPALLLNGDIEGQYTIYTYWATRSRHCVQKTKTQVPGSDEEIDDVHEVELKAEHPEIEIIADADLLVLPYTADSLTEALTSGGSVTVVRRWGEAKLKQLAEEGQLDKGMVDDLCEEMQKDPDGRHEDRAKKAAQAAGVKNDGRGKYALVYETWSMVKTPEGPRLCRTFFGGPEKVMACHRNPNWCDRIPIISAPVKKVAGSFKGQSLVSNGVDTLQYFANDIMNQAADSATYSMNPIIMTDPEKNPRYGSMVLAQAAVWQTSPNDTQFAQFPPLWKDGLSIVAAAKQEVFQALSVSPAIIPHGVNKKQSQAEVANEQQIDLLTTADAVTVLESGVLTPLITLFMELDHQYRDEEITVMAYGDLGRRANMEAIPPMQMDRRYEFRWFGVEAARSAQQMQQQIAAMNILKGIPPQMYPGYKLNLTPLIQQMAENAFGPRLGPLIFEKLSPPMKPQEEVELALNGFMPPVSPFADHMAVMKLAAMAMQQHGDMHGTLRELILLHQQAQVAQAQAQQQQQGTPGSPGGGGAPGAAGTPRPGAQPGRLPIGGQNPPGAIHQDRMPLAMPRKAM